MQSKYQGDMGFDFDPDDNQEVNKEESRSIGEQTATNELKDNVTSETNISESPEVSGIPIQEYFDTDYNKFDTDYTQKEQESQSYSAESTSSYESDSSIPSTSSSEKNSDPWAGAKLLLTPITFIANIISTPFSALKNTDSSTEKQLSTDEITPEPVIDDNFDGVDYQEHQKDVGSTNKILGAMIDTVKGAAQTNIEECKKHKFQYPEREKLHNKTGGTENIEMVGVNVFLDKSGKPLLPGARKSLKQHANAKQESLKENNSEIHPPSEATSHALKEFDIAHEFGKGEDEYDLAGSLIHKGKGIVELVALDLEPIQGGITSQPGFVPDSATIISKIREREKALKKDSTPTISTTTTENVEEGSNDLSSVKKV
ncbi:hypothetical protein [Legionella sp. WA2022007384]